MKKVEGDLLKLAQEGHFDVIVHGCNCQCVMGAGIAKSIKKIFPEAYKADCQTSKGSREKMGTYSKAVVRVADRDLTIVNGYTQYHWRGKTTKADYDAIRAVFKGLKHAFKGQKIGYPKLGAGLAGGDWNIIEKIICEELEGEDHTLVVYVP